MVSRYGLDEIPPGNGTPAYSALGWLSPTRLPSQCTGGDDHEAVYNVPLVVPFLGPLAVPRLIHAARFSDGLIHILYADTWSPCGDAQARRLLRVARLKGIYNTPGPGRETHHPSEPIMKARGNRPGSPKNPGANPFPTLEPNGHTPGTHSVYLVTWSLA